MLYDVRVSVSACIRTLLPSGTLTPTPWPPHIHTHTHTLRSYSFSPAYTLARTYRSPRPPVPPPTVTSMAMFPGLVRPLYRACGTSLIQCYNALLMPFFHFISRFRIIYTLNALFLFLFNFNCVAWYSDYDLFPPLLQGRHERERRYAQPRRNGL